MAEKRKVTKRQQIKNRRSRGQDTQMWIIGGVLLAVLLIVGFLVYRSASNSGVPVETTATDKSAGPADSKVVVTEYGDFQCPACKTFALNIEPKIRTEFADTGKVLFQFRHMAFIGEESTRAAEASECANDQGRFWDFYEKIYQEQGGENVGTYSENNLNRFAADLKLNTDEFKQCLSSGKYRGKVAQETQVGQQKGVNQTPSVLINDKLIDWGGDYSVLQSNILRAIQEAQ